MQHIFKPILLFAIIFIILLTGCQKQSTFNIQNTDKPKELIKKLEATTPITTVRFNPQHPTQVALGLQNGLVHLWNFAENKLSTLTAHKHVLIDIAFSPDGSLLATGGYDDKILRIWNIHKMQEIQSFSLHERIMKVAFSPDGTHLAVAVFDDKKGSNNIGSNDIVIWDIQQKKIVKRLKKHKLAVSNIIFSEDNQWLVSGSFDHSVIIWHWKTGSIENTFHYSLPITSIDLTIDKQLLAIGFQDGHVQLREINTEKFTHVIKHDSWTSQLIFFQNGKRLISSSFQNKVTIQKLPEQTIETEIKIYQTISRVDLNKTEDRIAVSLMDGTVRIYDLQGQLQDLLVMSATAKEWLSCDYNQQTCLKTNPPIDFVTLLKNFYSLFFLIASILIGVILWFYLHVYKHPLTLQLSANPKDLLKLPLQQLPEAKRLLQMTGRLNTILAKCQISHNTFEQAISFLNATPEEQANILAQRLTLEGIELQTSQVFFIKLSSLYLNLENCLFYFPAKDLVTDKIVEQLTHQEIFQNKKVIIITLELDKQHSLRPYGKDRRNEWIVPDELELTKLLLSATPIETFSRIVSSQLNLAKLSPYQMSGGLSKEESFFGRINIISDIMSRQLRNYLIIGGRQIGKTSLLNYLKLQYNKKRPDLEVHYLCLYNADIILQLASCLNLNAETNFEQMSNYLDDLDKVNIFLLDETDALIKYEKQRDYLNLHKLRSLSSKGKCYFILAGVWHLYESALLEYYSPLRNFGEIITLGELEYEACQDLIVQPLEALNISIKNEQLTKYIIKQTGQRANLISRICHLLLCNLNNTAQVIDKAMLDKVLQDDELQRSFLAWEGIAPSYDEQVLDKMIVYTTVQQGCFTLQTVLDNLKAYQFPHNRDNVKTELDRLSLEFVFKKVEHGQYIYAVPLLRENLLQENIERLILELDI